MAFNSCICRGTIAICSINGLDYYGSRLAICTIDPIMLLISSVLFLFFGKIGLQIKNLHLLAVELLKSLRKVSRNAVLVSFQVLKSATTQPAFWILSATFFICGLSSTGIVGQHFIPFCADNNVGIVAASSYLAIMGIFNFIGTIGSGWLLIDLIIINCLCGFTD